MGLLWLVRLQVSIILCTIFRKGRTAKVKDDDLCLRIFRPTHQWFRKITAWLSAHFVSIQIHEAWLIVSGISAQKAAGQPRRACWRLLALVLHLSDEWRGLPDNELRPSTSEQILCVAWTRFCSGRSEPLLESLHYRYVCRFFTLEKCATTIYRLQTRGKPWWNIRRSEISWTS